MSPSYCCRSPHRTSGQGHFHHPVGSCQRLFPTLVFEVLGGRKMLARPSPEIAIKLGMKEGEICANPAQALQRRAA